MVCVFSRSGEKLIVFMLLSVSGNKATGFMGKAEISRHNLVS